MYKLIYPGHVDEIYTFAIVKLQNEWFVISACLPFSEILSIVLEVDESLVQPLLSLFDIHLKKVKWLLKYQKIISLKIANIMVHMNYIKSFGNLPPSL